MSSFIRPGRAWPYMLALGALAAGGAASSAPAHDGAAPGTQAALGQPRAADAAPRRADATRSLADLRVVTVKTGAETIVAGGSVSVNVTIANRGSARAARSRTAYYLSRDRRRGADVRLHGELSDQFTSALGRLARWKRQGSLRVPVGVERGRYRLLVCADVRKRVSEKREANNCRLTAARLQVLEAPPRPSTPPETPEPPLSRLSRS